MNKNNNFRCKNTEKLLNGYLLRSFEKGEVKMK